MQSDDSPSRTLSVRLPGRLYEQAQGLAKQRKMSLNALMQECLAKSILAAEEQVRYEAYSLLGGDSDTTTEYSIGAQGEVMLRDEE